MIDDDIKQIKLEKILVDFDGVIHDCNPLPGFKMGKPIEGTIEALMELAKSYEIIVFTVRDDSNNHVTNWLRYFQVPYDRVTNVKEDGKYFIDDKAIRFERWEETLNLIKQYDARYE